MKTQDSWVDAFMADPLTATLPATEPKKELRPDTMGELIASMKAAGKYPTMKQFFGVDLGEPETVQEKEDAYLEQIGATPKEVDDFLKIEKEFKRQRKEIFSKGKPTYIVYETSNSLNDTKYIGCFGVDPASIHDRSHYHYYIGNGISGYDSQLRTQSTVFANAVKEIGYDNFTRKDLFHFDSLEEARLKEKELIINSTDNLYNRQNLKISIMTETKIMADQERIAKNLADIDRMCQEIESNFNLTIKQILE